MIARSRARPRDRAFGQQRATAAIAPASSAAASTAPKDAGNYDDKPRGRSDCAVDAGNRHDRASESQHRAADAGDRDAPDARASELGRASEFDFAATAAPAVTTTGTTATATPANSSSTAPRTPEIATTAPATSISTVPHPRARPAPTPQIATATDARASEFDLAATFALAVTTATIARDGHTSELVQHRAADPGDGHDGARNERRRARYARNA